MLFRSEIQEYLKTLESHQDDYIDYELVHTFINEPLKRYYIIISKLRQKFKNWVESISISDSHSIFKIRKDSVFLTFNYTKTLEVLYNIDESQICHIHGKVGDKELIFGHDWEHNITFDSLNDININQSNQEQEFNRRIFDEFKDQIINPLKKNPINIIENTPFFYELENLKIKNIIVLGHSLSNVDIPYFEEIYERVNNVKWFISFYNEEDRKKIEMFKKRFNLDDNCCQIIHMKDLLHMNIRSEERRVGQEC